jgi:hypothetical protein
MSIDAVVKNMVTGGEQEDLVKLKQKLSQIEYNFGGAPAAYSNESKTSEYIFQILGHYVDQMKVQGQRLCIDKEGYINDFDGPGQKPRKKRPDYMIKKCEEKSSMFREMPCLEGEAMFVIEVKGLKETLKTKENLE